MVKKEKGIYQGKTCFSKVLSINESALWRHNLKKKNIYKMAMDDPIRITLVPLIFILQGLSELSQQTLRMAKKQKIQLQLYWLYFK